MAGAVLIISGLDPSGGAGFIADVRVASEHGHRPVGVVTALTEQDTTGVRRVEVMNSEHVSDQVRALLSDIEVAAVKIGMLGSLAMCEALEKTLALTAAPVVWDPIVRPSRGGVALFDGDVHGAAAALSDHLSVLTPNAAEAALLWGNAVDDRQSARAAARDLAERYRCAALVTGGHIAGDDAVDVLASAGELHELTAPRVGGGSDIHGTGCALSTSLACQLAAGTDLVDAVRAAKCYVAERLANPARPGRGSPAVV